MRPRLEAVWRAHEGLDLRRAGHAEEDDVAVARERLRALGLLGAASHEVIDRSAVAMAEDGKRKTLGEEIFRHAVAHEAEADEADAFGHADQSNCVYSLTAPVIADT